MAEVCYIGSSTLVPPRIICSTIIYLNLLTTPPWYLKSVRTGACHRCDTL